MCFHQYYRENVNLLIKKYEGTTQARQAWWKATPLTEIESIAESGSPQLEQGLLDIWGRFSIISTNYRKKWYIQHPSFCASLNPTNAIPQLKNLVRRFVFPQLHSTKAHLPHPPYSSAISNALQSNYRLDHSLIDLKNWQLISSSTSPWSRFRRGFCHRRWKLGRWLSLHIPNKLVLFPEK